jgi:hypothetical protein
MVQFSVKVSLTCITDDQKEDLVELFGASQKLVLGKYLDLRIAVRKELLPVAMFQAA